MADPHDLAAIWFGGWRSRHSACVPASFTHCRGRLSRPWRPGLWGPAGHPLCQQQSRERTGCRLAPVSRGCRPVLRPLPACPPHPALSPPAPWVPLPAGTPLCTAASTTPITPETPPQLRFRELLSVGFRKSTEFYLHKTANQIKIRTFAVEPDPWSSACPQASPPGPSPSSGIRGGRRASLCHGGRGGAEGRQGTLQVWACCSQAPPAHSEFPGEGYAFHGAPFLGQ